MGLISWLHAREEVSRLSQELSEAQRALSASEAKLEAERERHLKREDYWVNMVAQMSGRLTISPPSVAPKPLPQPDPNVMSARDEAKQSWFIEDAIAAGKTEQDGKDAFEEWRIDGLMPFERKAN